MTDPDPRHDLASHCDTLRQCISRPFRSCPLTTTSARHDTAHCQKRWPRAQHKALLLSCRRSCLPEPCRPQALPVSCRCSCPSILQAKSSPSMQSSLCILRQNTGATTQLMCHVCLRQDMVIQGRKHQDCNRLDRLNSHPNHAP